MGVQQSQSMDPGTIFFLKLAVGAIVAGLIIGFLFDKTSLRDLPQPGPGAIVLTIILALLMIYIATIPNSVPWLREWIFSTKQDINNRSTDDDKNNNNNQPNDLPTPVYHCDSNGNCYRN